MAGNYITELLAYIGLDVDEGDFDNAERQLQGLHKAMLGIIAAAGAMSTAAATAAFELVSQFSEVATETDKFSARLGVTTQQLQEMTYAASTFGIEQDALVDGMKELSLRTDEFVKTGQGGAAESFQRLGLTQKELAGYTNDTAGLFDLLLGKLREVGDAAARQRLSDELFGGSGGEQFIPMLSASAEQIDALKKEAQELGLVIDTESIKAAKGFGMEMRRLNGVFQGAKNEIAKGLLPVFVELAKDFREFLTQNRTVFIDSLTAAFKALTESIRYLGYAMAVVLPYLVGTAALAGWAALVKGITTVITLFRTLRIAAILAWAAAYAGPALIGAAILGIIYALQDVYTYFNGGKSVTGLMVKKFADAADQIKKKWEELKNWFKDLFSDIKNWATEMLPDWVRDLVTKGVSLINENNSSVKKEVSFAYPGMPVSRESGFAYPGMPQVNVENLRSPAPVMPGVESPASGAPSIFNTPTSSTTNNTSGPTNIYRVENVNVQDSNPATFAESFAREARRQSANTVKNIDSGVDY